VWCYNVVYEDGDTEHLEFAEIEALHQQQKHLYAVRLQEQRLQQQQQQQSARQTWGLCDGHSVSTLLAQNAHKRKDDNPRCEELKRQKRRGESKEIATETSGRPKPIAAPITPMTSPSNGSAGLLSAKETTPRHLRTVTLLIREQATAGNGSNKHPGRVSSTGTMASATSKAHSKAISEVETASTTTSKRRSSSITIVNSGEAPSLLEHCRADNWEAIFEALIHNPRIVLDPIVQSNHISTTILHQALTSKGCILIRTKEIRCILQETPEAAAVKNGYNSLPLHVLCQRNMKMDAKTKQALIVEIARAHPQALATPGGVTHRTPLHISFTGKLKFHDMTMVFPIFIFNLADYLLSQDCLPSRLLKILLNVNPQACSMTDNNGWLPAHVACSRHCSPEKLGMLLSANSGALTQKTVEGETLLSLAKKPATISHPNLLLIRAIESRLSAGFNHGCCSV